MYKNKKTVYLEDETLGIILFEMQKYNLRLSDLINKKLKMPLEKEVNKEEEILNSIKKLQSQVEQSRGAVFKILQTIISMLEYMWASLGLTYSPPEGNEALKKFKAKLKANHND